MTTLRTRLEVDATTSLRRAWWSLLGFVVTFVVAFGVGEGLASALGHPPGDDQPAEPWVLLAAGLPALVVFALPAVPAVLYGQRAVRLGEPRGRRPALVALFVAGGFVLLNLASGVAVLLAG